MPFKRCIACGQSSNIPSNKQTCCLVRGQNIPARAKEVMVPLSLVEEAVQKALQKHGISKGEGEDQAEDFQDGMTILASDIHIPLHHQRGVENLVRACEDLKSSGDLKRLILNGDVFDSTNNSNYPKGSRLEGHHGDLGDEIQQGAGVLNALVDCFEDAVYQEGNHEARLARVLAKNLGVPEAPLAYEALFRFYGYHPRLRVYNQRLLLLGRGEGSVGIIHGEKFNQHTAATVLRDNMYRNTIQGHTHRPQVFWVAGKFGLVNGHLHDVSKQHYAPSPDWTMGFTVLEHWDGGRKVNPYFVRVYEDGSFRFQGKTYK